MPDSTGDIVLPDVKPDWLHKPSSEELASAYPARAMEKAVEGKALIQCVVRIGGDLESCKVLSEEPAGYGFGEAALSLTPRFRLEPAMRDGVQQSSTVRIPIAFKLPQPRPQELFSRADAAGAAVLGCVLLAALVVMALNDWLRGRAGAPKVRFWRGVAFSLRFVGRAWRTVPGPLLVCAAIAALELAATVIAGDNALLPIVFTLPLIVAQIFAYGACYRVALADIGGPERMRPGRFGFSAGAVERGVAFSFLISGLIFLAALLAAVVVGLILAMIARLAVGEANYALAAAAVAGLCAGVLLYVMGRLYFLPAVFSVEGLDGLGTGWRLARAVVFAGLGAMLMALVLLALALGVVTLPLYAAGVWPGGQWGPGQLATLISSATLLPFSAGLMSYFYLETRSDAAG